MTKQRPIYVLAAGAYSPSDGASDAQPVPLRPKFQEVTGQSSRLLSRFIELATIGATLCLSQRRRESAPEMRVCLATGLGDIGRTDALYDQVMPPTSEAASPAQFVASGNNMAAFFVARAAGCTGRCFTVSDAELSFERALMLAVDDLAAGAAMHVLVGGVDETAGSRERYLRRFMLDDDERIGEGSGWLLLGAQPDDAIGELLGVATLAARPGEARAAWTDRVAAQLADWTIAPVSVHLAPGCRLAPEDSAAISARLRAESYDYLRSVGRFPTAAALAAARALEDQVGGVLVHVNRDTSGRTSLFALHSAS